MDDVEVLMVADDGLMLVGAVASPGHARDIVRSWLTSNGMSWFDAEAAVTTARVRRQHWGGSRRGFVAAEHPDAKPVVLVHIGHHTYFR